MTVSKKLLYLVLAGIVLGSGVVFGLIPAYQNYQVMQALAENTEYQVLTAIEAQHPEIYVVAVKQNMGHVFVYFIAPEENRGEEYGKDLLVDIVAILYKAYPQAETYHALPTEITEVDTFEGKGHIGMAVVGYGFTNYAAETMANETCPSCVMDRLFEAGELGIYQPRQMGLHLVLETTPREPGHIPPWASVEE